MKCINGWTKASLISYVKSNFKGKAVSKRTSEGVYLTKDGKKCPVGLFIPQGHPGQRCKNNIYYLLERYPDLKKFIPLTKETMKRLQIVHDLSEESKTLDEIIDFIERNVNE